MKKIYLALLLTVILLSSCTIAKISGRGNIPMLLNNPTTKVEFIEHISVSKMIVFDYTNAFDVSEILKDVMAKYTEADAITNLVITLKSDAGTFFVNLFTLGIANARTFEVEGDLVKLPDGISYNMKDYNVIGEIKPTGEFDINQDELFNKRALLIKTDDGIKILAMNE